MLKKIAFIFLLLFITANFLLGYWGQSTILLTAAFYVLLWLFFKKLISLLTINQNRKINYQLLTKSLIISLFAAEFLLRYVFQTCLSYDEKNGSFFYKSEYKKYLVENIARATALKQEDIQLRVHKPFSENYSEKIEFNYVHRFNSLGLRGREPFIDSSFMTIVGLGDSFTEGVGAPQDSTWVVLLEDNLNSNSPPQKFQCINGGSNGSDPFFEYIILERELIRYRPQLVVVSINLSDINDVIVRGGMERFTEDGSVVYNSPPWWEFFYQFSFIFRNIAHTFFKLNWLLLTEKQLEEETKIALSKIKSCIEGDYKKLSQKMQFQLLVVLHPMQDELEKNQFSLQILGDSLKMDTSITTINLFEEIKETKEKIGFDFANLFWPIDLHNNSRGYQLWADILSEKLIPLVHKASQLSSPVNN